MVMAMMIEGRAGGNQFPLINSIFIFNPLKIELSLVYSMGFCVQCSLFAFGMPLQFAWGLVTLLLLPMQLGFCFRSIQREIELLCVSCILSKFKRFLNGWFHLTILWHVHVVLQIYGLGVMGCYVLFASYLRVIKSK